MSAQTESPSKTTQPEEEATGPNAVLEIARRFLLVGGLFGAIYAWFGYDGDLLKVEPCDFVKRLAQRQSGDSSPFFRSDAKEERQRYLAMSLEDFIAEQTEGRVLRGADADWTGMADAAQEARGGRAWQERRGLEHLSNQFFFRARETPLASLSDKFSSGVAPWYVEVQSNGVLLYLQVAPVGPSDLALVPAAVACPWRSLGLPLIALAILGYVLLPWSKVLNGSVHYSRRGLVVADIVGAVFAAVFFAGPLLILRSGGGPAPGRWALDFDSSAGIITLAFWLTALLFCYILVADARQASVQIQTTPEGVRAWDWRGGPRSIPFEDIEGIRAIRFRGLMHPFHWWGPLRWQIEKGIEINPRSGRPIRLSLTGLRNTGALVTECNARCPEGIVDRSLHHLC